MSNLQTANTILAQLGGKRFVVMTGAKNFVGSADSLGFSLPARFAKGGINKVRVTLTPDDLYTVEFFKLRGVDIRVIAQVEGIYADQLQSAFTEATGLDTRF